MLVEKSVFGGIHPRGTQLPNQICDLRLAVFRIHVLAATKALSPGSLNSSNASVTAQSKSSELSSPGNVFRAPLALPSA